MNDGEWNDRRLGWDRWAVWLAAAAKSVEVVESNRALFFLWGGVGFESDREFHMVVVADNCKLGVAGRLNDIESCDGCFFSGGTV